MHLPFNSSIPSISITDLYKKYTQEYIMQFYLSKIANTDIKLSSKMYNPMRVDKHPSSGVYYKLIKGINTLMFKDFTGYFSGDCIAVAGYYYGNTKNGKLKGSEFTNVIHKIVNELEGITCTEIQLKKSKFKPLQLDQVSEDTYNIRFKIRKVNGKVKWIESDKEYWGKVFTPNFLLKSNIFPVEKVWLEYNNNIELKYISSKEYPVYVYLFNKGETIKVLAPNHGKKHKWRNNGNQNVIEGYDLLKEDTIKVWCTSYKDSLCFNAHSDLQGYNYLGEYVLPKSYIEDKLLDNTKYVFIDNDMTGKRIGVEIRKTFPELKILCIPKQMGVKDPFEFICKFGIEYSKRCLNRIL